MLKVLPRVVRGSIGLAGIWVSLMGLGLLSLSCGQSDIPGDTRSMARIGGSEGDAVKSEEPLEDEDIVAEAPAVISGAYISCVVKNINSGAHTKRISCQIRGVQGKLSSEQIAELYRSLKIEGAAPSNIAIDYDEEAAEDSYSIAFDVNEQEVENITSVKVELDLSGPDAARPALVIENVNGVLADVAEGIVGKRGESTDKGGDKRADGDEGRGASEQGDKAMKKEADRGKRADEIVDSMFARGEGKARQLPDADSEKQPKEGIPGGDDDKELKSLVDDVKMKSKDEIGKKLEESDRLLKQKDDESRGKIDKVQKDAAEELSKVYQKHAEKERQVKAEVKDGGELLKKISAIEDEKKASIAAVKQKTDVEVKTLVKIHSEEQEKIKKERDAGIEAIVKHHLAGSGKVLPAQSGK